MDMKLYKKRVWITAAIGFALFFTCLTIFFGKVPETNVANPKLIDWLANWIFHYQNLLAAAVAACGVYFTIKEMNKSGQMALYAEWNTVVFEAMIVGAKFDALIKVHDILKNKVNNIKTIDDFDDQHLKAIANLKGIIHLYTSIKSSKLNIYLAEHIIFEEECCKKALTTFEESLLFHRKSWSNGLFDHRKYYIDLCKLDPIYDMVSTRTRHNALKFVEHSGELNPMRLDPSRYET